MSNHPNRNWRARLNAAADQWSAGREAELLARMPVSDPKYWLTRIRLAYLAGLRDGEKRELDLFILDRENKK